MIAGVISYMPKGVKPDVLSYWYQKQGGPIFNDCICVAAKATKPVIAHRFLNYMLDNKVGLRELHRLRRLPAAADRDRRPAALRRRASSPRRSSQAVVTREAYANGNAYLTLSAKGLQLWDRDLGVVPQRLMGSRWIWRALARPGPRLAGALLRRRLLRDHQRRPGQRHHALRAGPALEPAGLERRLHLGGAQGRRARAATRGTPSCARIIYVVVAVVLSLAIGYPVAWYAARHAGRWRGPILVLLVLPFWISYLMRMFAWTNLLADERLRDARAARAVDRHAVPEARAARRRPTGSAASTSR